MKVSATNHVSQLSCFHCNGFLLKNLLFLWHWRTRNGLLKGKIGVMSSANVGNIKRRIAVAGERHPLSHGDGRIIHNHTKSQLTSAVIPVKMTIFDGCFFVEFLAEL
jgi:hypothetical protein